MPEWTSPDGLARVINGEALATLTTLPDASVSLIATDPPYFRVKQSDWDRAWKSEREFLDWTGTVLDECRRVLKPNGSIYWFASPQMAWSVEGEVRNRFNMLANIRWRKPPFSTKAEMFVKEDLRAPFPASETILFAEQFGSDEAADGQAGYTSACEQTKRSIFGDYLRSEFERASVTQRQVAALFPSATGGLTGCVSNWLLGYNCPTPQQYDAMRQLLNKGGESKYLRREYEYLRREYEDLRREYEDLRREFSLRADDQYTDVWDFATVGQYPGKHECEKPIDLVAQIVRVSSRPGDTVLDCFAGSGVTGQAAVEQGRNVILVEQDPHWYAQAIRRIEGRKPEPRKTEKPCPLFDQLEAA